MIEFKEMINLKAAVIGAVFLTALSGLVPESAEATAVTRGRSHSLPCNIIGTPYCDTDPPAGTYFSGRTTIRFNREKVSPIDKSSSGWFGSFSNQPETPFPDTGDGIFADPNTPFNLLEPNDNLTVSYCDIRFGDPIGCDFDPFVSLQPPGEEFSIAVFRPQEFPEDDFFAVNFDFGTKGLTVDTEESFNFFGFSYQFNQEAFEDKVVGISLVESGTGDFGLLPREGFNITNCIAQGSPDSNFATDRCGEPDFPLDVAFITRSQVLAASTVPGFSFDSNTQEGSFATGEPFQLFDDPLAKVNEPDNNLGLLALGAFVTNLLLKRKRK